MLEYKSTKLWLTQKQYTNLAGNSTSVWRRLQPRCVMPQVPKVKVVMSSTATKWNRLGQVDSSTIHLTLIMLVTNPSQNSKDPTEKNLLCCSRNAKNLRWQGRSNNRLPLIKDNEKTKESKSIVDTQDAYKNVMTQRKVAMAHTNHLNTN